jgi:hypothetical protein
MKMNRTIVGSALIGSCLLLLLVRPAEATFLLHFDSPSYSVTPGGTLTVNVVYDTDPNTPGDQPIPGGLFSEGLKVLFPSAGASVASTSDFVLPSALNSNGIGGAADESAGPGFAGGAGAEDLSANSGYAGTVLATVTLQDLATTGTYTLSLDKYYPSKANFVSYADGSTLDPQLSFGTATVTVTSSAVPEPATAWLMGLAAGGLLRRWRRVTC